MKTCIKCKVEKQSTAFSRRNDKKDGRKNVCCACEYVFYRVKWMKKNPGSYYLGNIKQRCLNPKDPKYAWYGGKGIQVKITKEEIAYLWQRDNAHLQVCPSIDRIDPKGHYEVANCRFIELMDNVMRVHAKTI